MIKNKKEVIKHSSAIQVSNKTTLLQRRCWNVLLANAYDELHLKEKYSIKISDLSDVLWFDSKNIDYLKKSLKAIRQYEIEWNILWKDWKQEWGTAWLLSEATISWWILTYAYSPTVREKLYKPNMYAKINLSMQNKFDSKYSLTLYELFIDYFDVSRKEWETPFINIKEFRLLVWLEDKEYIEFKILNRDVIKKSLNEINKKSDLSITVDYKRHWRSVIEIKFFIKIKETNKISLKSSKSDIYWAYFIRLQKSFLLSPQQAEEIIEKYNDLLILDTLLKELQQKYSTNKIQNLGSYSYTFLKNHNWIIKTDIKKKISIHDIEEVEYNKDISNNKGEFRLWFSWLDIEKQNQLMEQYKKWSPIQDKEMLIKSRISSDFQRWLIK